MAITKTVFDVVKDSIKPYIDSQNATLSNEVDTLSSLVEGASEITTKSFSPVIAVTDALPVNAVDVLAKIEPIQAGSGTPSPSNVRAISGRTEITVTRAGKNLVEETYVHANIDSTGGLRVESSQDFNVCVARVKKGCTYVMSINSTVTMPVYAFYTSKPINGSYSYDGNRIVGGNAYFIAPIDGYVAFRDVLNETKTQLELGSTTTAYETPNVNNYTIQLGDTYYGGTLDVTTGVLTVNAEYKTYNGGSDENWATNGDSGVALFISGYSEVIAINEYGIHDAGYATYLSDGEACMNVARTALQIKDSRAMTESDYRTLLASYPLEVVYELATPITVQLTPQEIQMLQGNNTIFTDSGDTSIQYYANGVKNLETVVAKIQTEADGAVNNQLENGCVNMLENKASSAVIDGITFTVNADKSVGVYGTLGANASAAFIINANGVYSNFIGKRLKLSGCPKNTGLSLCRITAYRVESADGSSGSVFDTGDGVVYEHLNNGTGTRARYQIEIYNSTSSAKTVNTTFKPMITVADMPNSDYAHYVPYCKSNKELTELWNANKYVEQAINWESNVDTYYDRTNTVAHFRVNEFTRHCVLDVTDLVTKFAMNVGEVTVLFNIGGSFIPFVNERKDVPILKKDSTYYSGFVTKASSHNGVSFTAKESIPSGVSITFTLDWTY